MYTYGEQQMRTNTDAQRVRQRLHALHDTIGSQAARKPSPLWGVSDWRHCGTCGAPTRVVERLDDGSEVPVCGACALHELDESAAQ